MQFFSFFLPVFLFITAAGCHKTTTPEAESGLFYRNLTVDDTTRRYAVYLPHGISGKAVPLVFELHGGGVYIEDMTGKSGHKTPYKLWMELAEQEKFIVVYPEGLNGSYGKPTWNDCRGDCIVSSGADDVHFIDTLITVLSSQYSIDMQRIYASGTSNGGFMAQRLGIGLYPRIAAVASVVAARPAVSSCGNPPGPLSILFMNGTDDNHMPYDGGTLSNPPNPDHGTVLPTEATVRHWITFDGTDTTAEYHLFPDLDPDDGGVVERYTYRHGSQGTEVVFYKVNGGGHSAPSIRERYSALFERYFNKQNHDIEMTTEVWAFFRDKQQPSTAATTR